MSTVHKPRGKDGNDQALEDIKAWQKSRELVKQIYHLSNSKSKFNKDIGITRADPKSISLGYEQHRRGFRQTAGQGINRFLSISLGSAAEVQSQLYVAVDQNYLTEKEFSDAYEAASETARLISGFMQYLTTRVTADYRLFCL